MFLIFNYVFLHFFFKFRAFTPHHRLLTLFLKSHNRYYTAIVKLATLAPAVQSPAPSHWKQLPYTHHIMGSERAWTPLTTHSGSIQQTLKLSQLQHWTCNLVPGSTHLHFRLEALFDQQDLSDMSTSLKVREWSRDTAQWFLAQASGPGPSLFQISRVRVHWRDKARWFLYQASFPELDLFQIWRDLHFRSTCACPLTP